MAGVNKIIIVGNLGRDPELKESQSGTVVARFSLAVSETWKDNGEKKERTEWVNCVAFGKLAEICGRYLARGRQVYIEGRLQTRSWEKNGEKRYMTEVIVNQMQMLGSRDAGEATQDPASKEAFPVKDNYYRPDHDEGDVPF